MDSKSQSGLSPEVKISSSEASSSTTTPLSTSSSTTIKVGSLPMSLYGNNCLITSILLPQGGIEVVTGRFISEREISCVTPGFQMHSAEHLRVTVGSSIAFSSLSWSIHTQPPSRWRIPLEPPVYEALSSVSERAFIHPAGSRFDRNRDFLGESCVLPLLPGHPWLKVRRLRPGAAVWRDGWRTR